MADADSVRGVVLLGPWVQVQSITSVGASGGELFGKLSLPGNNGNISIPSDVRLTT